MVSIYIYIYMYICIYIYIEFLKKVGPQRAQYPLMKEYALNYRGFIIMI